ncbi:MAG: hypothetical protein WDM79_15540 [Terricaulis sp.]
MRDEAPRLGGLDHLLHGGVGKIQDRTVRSAFFFFRRCFFGLAHRGSALLSRNKSKKLGDQIAGLIGRFFQLGFSGADIDVARFAA